MVAALAKNETPYKVGVGKVGEHTLVLGTQVIAINNIGSIRLVESGRSWWVAFVGLLIAGGAGSQVPIYGPLAWAGVGLGLVLILINMLVPTEWGLSIGTSDGRMAMIMSKDAAFLSRLLDLLVQKINSRDPALVASFDITNSSVYLPEDDGAFRNAPPQLAPAAAAGLSGVGDDSGGTAELAAHATRTAADIDETLFAGDADAPPKPPPVTEPAVASALATSASRTGPHDPLLGGPSIATPTRHDDERDWLKTPGRIVYEGDQGARSSGSHWIAPLLLLAVLAGAAVAAWLVMGRPDGATSVSFMPPASESPSQSITLADAVAEPSTPVAIEAAPLSPAIPAPVPGVPEPPATDALPTVVSAPDPSAVVAFTPAETMVARASGLRYRARPSSSDDVPVLAETRAGGEVLRITGRSIQSDGEWYRVTLAEGRAAWFKASLAVPSMRFAETFAAPAGAARTFAASAPRILEPAEGAQIPGGPQPVRLAWTRLETATVYIIEIQTFDLATQRWIDDPQARRLTIEAAEEIAENLPTTGAWRWRVRAVSADGEQSQFSRWAAFALRGD